MQLATFTSYILDVLSTFNHLNCNKTQTLLVMSRILLIKCTMFIIFAKALVILLIKSQIASSCKLIQLQYLTVCFNERQTFAAGLQVSFAKKVEDLSLTSVYHCLPKYD